MNAAAPPWCAGLLSLAILALFLGAWELATQGSGAGTATVDPEYAALVGQAASTGGQTPFPRPSQIGARLWELLRDPFYIRRGLPSCRRHAPACQPPRGRPPNERRQDRTRTEDSAHQAGEGLKWGDLAARITMSPVWTCALCMGQMSAEPLHARGLAEMLDLDDEDEATLCEIPYRGAQPMPPTDPLIYRFYELVLVYGTSWKEMIHEEFGDGIMSAIDYDMLLERLPDQKGDRVKITMTGKFLAYKRY